MTDITSKVKTFPSAPYFDDYTDEKDFLMVLFRPGYAVQTREVNQLQTIFQNQLARFANAVFDDGSKVIGGTTQFVAKYAFVKLTANLARSDLTEYIGLKVTNGTLTGTIVLALNVDGSDPATIYVQYNGVDSVDSDVSAFPNNATLTITHLDTSTEIATSAPTAATGFGSSTSVDNGIFYVKGRFVRVFSQTILLSKYVPLDNAEYSVGINMEEEIVTPETDSSLLDNAAGTTNETAPGAHRYLINGRYCLKSSLTDFGNFIELLKFRNAQVAEKARDNDLSVIDDILAKRTFDESGDYVIDEFLLDVREHLKEGDNLGINEEVDGGDENKMVYILDPGKAYVRGYAVTTESNTLLEADKARLTSVKPNTVTTLSYNNSITVNAVLGDMPRFFKKLYLKNSLSVTIGTAICRNFTFAGAGQFQLELVNLKLTGLLADVVTVTADNAFSATVIGSSISGEQSSLVYKLPFTFVKNLTDTRIEYFKEFTATLFANEFSLSSSTDTFSGDPEDYVIQYQSVGAGLVTTKPDSVVPSGTLVTASIAASVLLDADLAPASPSEDVKVICRLVRLSAIPKVKSKLSFTQSGVTPASSIALTKQDIVRVVSIIDTVTLEDVTDNFNLDNGQRESVYDNGAINLKAGEVLPANPIDIQYEYFEHSIGDYFTVQSYSSVDYIDIPYYTNTSGEKLFLADVVDFRNKVDANGVVSNAITTANVFDANSQLSSILTHYLSRIDKIAVNTKGQFSVITGVPNEIPEAPSDLNDAVTLYTITIPAYTFSVKDVTIRKQQQRRYTMRDIGLLDNRISTLEFYTSLNLLETDTANRNFTNAFKSGFIVDTFETQAVADSTSPDLKCSFDVIEKECRPQASMKNVNLEFGSSSGVVVKDGLVFMNYTEVPAVSQLLASVTERIQPFIRYAFDGQMRLVPDTDNWFTTIYRPDTIMDNGTYTIFKDSTVAVARGRGHPSWLFVFGAWTNTWAGRNVGGINVIGQVGKSNKIDTGTHINVTQIGDRVLSTSAIPYIRSRLVTFAATGLKPYTKVRPYFDGVDVSAYCKPTVGNFGDPLLVGPSGVVTGLFQIPNSDTLRFRTGIRNFVLKDDPTLPSTQTSAPYSASGILIERQKEFIGTRVIIEKRQFVLWHDPVAESFLIDEDGGAFVSSIDVYFGPEALTNDKQVTVEIREMVNGYPGTKILKSKTLDPSLIIGSIDATVATRFTFDSPVHIDSGREMCFVVSSDSEFLTLWTAKLGQKSVMPGDTTSASGQVINKQSYLGSMFKSQNNTTWTAAQDQDIKFTIQRAKFDVGTGTLSLTNQLNAADVGGEADVYNLLLDDNSLVFTDTSADIIVKHQDHGFKTGDVVLLTGDAGTLNGIPSTEIFTVPGRPVTFIDADSYQITSSLGSLANASGKNGTNLSASQVVAYSVAYFMSDEIALNGTTIAWEMVGTDKATGSPLAPVSITPKNNVNLKAERVVLEDGDGSLVVNATLTNNADNLSPVVDINRSAMVCVANRIDNVGDAAIYIQKPFTFVSAANKLKVFLDINRPSGTTIDVQYRTGQSEVTSAWFSMAAISTTPETSNYGDFVEYDFEASGITEFTAVQLRIIFKSTNLAVVPRIKNLRVVSLME